MYEVMVISRLSYAPMFPASHCDLRPQSMRRHEEAQLQAPRNSQEAEETGGAANRVRPDGERLQRCSQHRQGRQLRCPGRLGEK